MHKRNSWKLALVPALLGLASAAGCEQSDDDAPSTSSDALEVQQCIAQDTTPPALTSKTINLWPPNHKFHRITVDDCVSVSDDCQTNLEAEFIWASSDEPVDDIGDGHHAPDIKVSDCNAVELRAERQGPKNGRVYKLGVRVVDAAGNAAESVCTVVVDHDQRGVLGADSGESYRIDLNGTGGLPTCDGDNPLPPAPPTPPVTPTTPDAPTTPSTPTTPTVPTTPSTPEPVPQPDPNDPTLPI